MRLAKEKSIRLWRSSGPDHLDPLDPELSAEQLRVAGAGDLRKRSETESVSFSRPANSSPVCLTATNMLERLILQKRPTRPAPVHELGKQSGFTSFGLHDSSPTPSEFRMTFFLGRAMKVLLRRG